VSRGCLLLEMELRSDPEILCVVRNAVGELAKCMGFREAECRAAVLAVDEALTNIIRHAYRGQKGRPIKVSFRRIRARQGGAPREALEIELADRGVNVKRAKLSGRPLEEVRPGGLGLHFIRESMDAVEFRRKNGGNRLRMVKFFQEAEPQKSS